MLEGKGQGSQILMIYQLFKKKIFRNAIRVSNSMDLDQTRHFVGPDLGPNCLQRLSAAADDDTSLYNVTDHIPSWHVRTNLFVDIMPDGIMWYTC